MYQPGIGGHRLWRRSNIQVAGIMIAGNCVLVILFFGFGLLLIGTFSMVTSTAFDPKPSDPLFFRDSTNVPRLIGKIFLSIGAVIFGGGLILLFCIIQKAKEQARNNQGQAGTNAVLAGGMNYASTQPYYPTQPNAQFQPYPSTVGQAYPQASGQGQSYQPVISGQGQPYSQGPGQPYLQGPGQPYPPVGGQVQNYPQGPGQPYLPDSGQGQPYPPVAKQEQHYPSSGSEYPHTVGGPPYPPTGGNAEKSTELTQLPYNPGHPYQAPPSGYPGSGHLQMDAPPPTY